MFDAEPEKDEGSGEWLFGAGGDEIKRVKEDEYIYRDIKWEDEKARSLFNPLIIHQKEGGFPAFKEDNGMPHTPHYMNGLIETIDVIKMALTPEEFKGFLKGNVLKYELRAPYKHETPDADYQKAKDYYDLLEEENQ